MKFKILCPVLICITLCGCGKVRNAPEKTVVVRDQAPSRNGDVGSTDADFNQIKDFIELYIGKNGVSRDGLANLFDKYKDLINKILAGTKISPDDLMNLLFQFDANHDGKLTVGEISDGIAQHIPILRWIPDNTTEIGHDELKAQVLKEYAPVSDAAAEGLTDSLLKFDQTWAGGNANDKVGRKELATAGLILGLLQDTDFSKTLTPPLPADLVQGGNSQAFLKDQIRLKLNQRLFSRYPVARFEDLKPEDQQLEAMTLAIDLDLMDKLVRYYGTDGKIPASKQIEALSAFGLKYEKRWTLLLKFYDSPLLGGDGDGSLNTLEAFNLLTDLDYTERVLAWTQGSLSAESLGKLPGEWQLFQSLESIYPRAGSSVFVEFNQDTRSPEARKKYWDDLGRFDDPKYGGDASKTIDAGELTMAFGSIRLLDSLYAMYDTNQDGLISKAEAAPLFARLGFSDPQVIDAFFANIGLDGNGGGIFDTIGAILSGASRIDTLSPYDFYIRMIQVLPKVLAQDQVKSS